MPLSPRDRLPTPRMRERYDIIVPMVAAQQGTRPLTDSELALIVDVLSRAPEKANDEIAMIVDKKIRHAATLSAEERIYPTSFYGDQARTETAIAIDGIGAKMRRGQLLQDVANADLVVTVAGAECRIAKATDPLVGEGLATAETASNAIAKQVQEGWAKLSKEEQDNLALATGIAEGDRRASLGEREHVDVDIDERVYVVMVLVHYDGQGETMHAICKHYDRAVEVARELVRKSEDPTHWQECEGSPYPYHVSNVEGDEVVFIKEWNMDCQGADPKEAVRRELQNVDEVFGE